MESKIFRCGILNIVSGLTVYGMLSSFINVFGFVPSGKFEIFALTMLFATFWTLMFAFPKLLLIGIPALLGGVAWIVFKIIGYENINTFLEYKIAPYFEAFFRYPTQDSEKLTIDFLVISFVLSIVMCFFIVKLQSNAILFLFSAPFMFISVYPQIFDKFLTDEMVYPSFVGIYTSYSIFSFIILLLCNIGLITFNIYEKSEYPELYQKVKEFKSGFEFLIISIAFVIVALVILKYVLMAYILYNAIVFIFYFILVVLFL